MRGIPQETGLSPGALDKLLDDVLQRYGYDLTGYARRPLRQRIRMFMDSEGIDTASELQDRVLEAPTFYEHFRLGLLHHDTEMFRDPDFFLAFRTLAVPILRKQPFLRLWCAGCATGEEVYSLAIILEEEGLYDRSLIYGTDVSEVAIHKAKDGIFPLSSMRENTHNYIRSGGKKCFSQYYSAGHYNAILSQSLKRNIVFGRHDAARDAAFSEFDVIFCRNVLMYMRREMKDRVLDSLHNSLLDDGVLGLGDQESLSPSAHADCYKQLSATEKLFRKIA